MDIGVFIPIGNNGWLISETSPQYMPSFELNKTVTQTAERYGFDFALSMIKLRGFGGKTQFWEHNLESFTLMAGLAAVTSRIKIFATAATLTMPPAIVARMASTIDSIAPGRFGINLITGWQKAEYDQMGLWPGERHYNPIGSMHGGVFATLLDSACGCAVHSTLAVGEGYTSLDLTVKFLKAVTVDSGRLRAVGTVMQRGRRTALAEARLYDGRDRLVAYASSSCLIF